MQTKIIADKAKASEVKKPVKQVKVVDNTTSFQDRLTQKMEKK